MSVSVELLRDNVEPEDIALFSAFTLTARFWLTLVFGSILALALNGVSLSQPINRASLPWLTLSVTLDHNSAGEPMLIETFSTTDPVKHSVICRSGFLDVKYQLRNEAGRLIPVNPEPWKIGSDIAYQTINGTVRGAPDLCMTLQIAQSHRRVLLRALYPQLPHGTYTLRVILSPRGRSESAEAPTITLTV